MLRRRLHIPQTETQQCKSVEQPYEQTVRRRHSRTTVWYFRADASRPLSLMSVNAERACFETRTVPSLKTLDPTAVLARSGARSLTPDVRVRAYHRRHGRTAYHHACLPIGSAPATSALLGLGQATAPASSTIRPWMYWCWLCSSRRSYGPESGMRRATGARRLVGSGSRTSKRPR